MPKISNVFSTNYFRTEDFDKVGQEFTISEVREEKVGKGRDAQRKIVVYFEESDNGLLLNKTNALAIAKILECDDTDDWAGGRIRVHRAETEFNGEPVDGLRVAKTKGTAKAKPRKTEMPE